MDKNGADPAPFSIHKWQTRVTGIYFVSVAIGGTYTAIYRINRVIGG